MIGGDHSIGYPCVRGVAPHVGGDIGIIPIDRHVDTQEKDMDERMHTCPWFHATNIPNAKPQNGGGYSGRANAAKHVCGCAARRRLLAAALGQKAGDWRPEPAPPSRCIDEGDVIDPGGRVFEVLRTPGHSWGGVCLWEERSGTLFCADTVYQGELFDFLPCSDVPTYIATLKRLRNLPVRVAHPGHGPVLDGAQFRSVIDTYLRSKESTNEH